MWPNHVSFFFVPAGGRSFGGISMTQSTAKNLRRKEKQAWRCFWSRTRVTFLFRSDRYFTNGPATKRIFNFRTADRPPCMICVSVEMEQTTVTYPVIMCHCRAQVGSQTGQDTAAEFGIRFVEVSAKTGVNVREAFMFVTTRAVAEHLARDRLSRSMGRARSKYVERTMQTVPGLQV